MTHPKLSAITAVLVLSLLINACGNGDDEPQRTAVAPVDAVIEVVESQDREALRDLFQFTSLPCAEEAGAGDRPRCLGEPAGTNVEVFQANECEQGWLRRDDLERVLDEVIALEPQVYAAFETPENFYVPGGYAVVFEGDDTRVDEEGLKRYMAMGVEADNGLITGLALGCGIDEPVHFLLPHLNEGFDDWLIEPEG